MTDHDLDPLAAAMHDAAATAHATITGVDNAVRWADLAPTPGGEHSRDVWRAAAAIAQDLAAACCGCNLAREAQRAAAQRTDLCSVCHEYPSHVEHRHPATPREATEPAARCMAHGHTVAEHDGKDCAAPSDRCQCGVFEVDGLHWDTCPGREHG